MGVPKSLEPLADFIDREFLRPHDTDITGAMIVGLKEEFGIPVCLTLTVLGAESSLGDPAMGGELARQHNYGCIKTAVVGPWDKTANGRVIVRGIAWWTWPDAETGMKAWGMYISQGPSFNPGYYLQAYPDWEKFCSVYYGSGVEDYHVYLRHVESLYEKFSSRLRVAGFTA